MLDPSEIVQEPGFPEAPGSSSSHRVCQSCYDEVTAAVPGGLRGVGANSMERVVVAENSLTIPASSGTGRNHQSSSQLSDLAEYVSFSIVYIESDRNSVGVQYVIGTWNK